MLLPKAFQITQHTVMCALYIWCFTFTLVLLTFTFFYVTLSMNAGTHADSYRERLSQNKQPMSPVNVPPQQPNTTHGWWFPGVYHIILLIELLKPVLNICVLFFAAVCRTPVFLDFVTRTVSPQVTDNFSGTSYVSKDNGKRPIDGQLDNIADQMCH